MLTELRVSNFKGFAGEHQVPLAPVTLLFGSNSSGKTALLHALALLAENLSNSPLRRRSDSFELSVPDLDLGGYRNLIHKHDTSPGNFIGLGATADLIGYRSRSTGPRSRLDDIVEVAGARSASHDFRLAQDEDGRVLPVYSSVVLHGAKDLPLEFNIPENGRHLELGYMSQEKAEQTAAGVKQILSSLAFSTPDVDAGEFANDDEYLTEGFAPSGSISMAALEQLPEATIAKMFLYGTGVRPGGSIGHMNTVGPGRPQRDSVFPQELANLLNEVIPAANAMLRRSLHRADYLGPMRDVPSRLEELGPITPDRLTSSGAGIAAMLDRDRRALELVNASLDHLDIPYTVDVRPVGQESLPSAGNYRALVLTDLRTNTQVSPRDLGFGITQLLPILVALSRHSSSLLLVEQPELHLHPRLHAELASSFVDAARQDQPTQVIAETHSENLVLRVQRLVRERALSPEEVSIVYVGSSIGAGSWIQPIRMDRQGQLIDPWPGGFFTERAQEWL